MNIAIAQKYPRKTWRLINDLNSRKANEAPNFEGSALTNPADISEAFNSHFTTIGEKLANEIPSSTVDPISYISPTNSVFTVEEIDVSTVDHLLRKINVNKATGLDGIPGKLLKMAASILSPSLTQIFNKSLFKDIYPNDWKMAKVLPIFKIGKKSHLSNYRPTSNISSVANVFGRLVYNQFYSYLNNNSRLSHHQSGFRVQHKHCTVTSLVY